MSHVQKPLEFSYCVICQGFLEGQGQLTEYVIAEGLIR